MKCDLFFVLFHFPPRKLVILDVHQAQATVDTWSCYQWFKMHTLILFSKFGCCRCCRHANSCLALHLLSLLRLEGCQKQFHSAPKNSRAGLSRWRKDEKCNKTCCWKPLRGDCQWEELAGSLANMGTKTNEQQERHNGKRQEDQRTQRETKEHLKWEKRRGVARNISKMHKRDSDQKSWTRISGNSQRQDGSHLTWNTTAATHCSWQWPHQCFSPCEHCKKGIAGVLRWSQQGICKSDWSVN